MNYKEICKNLCYYDPRNPNCILDKGWDDDVRKWNCYCDACFKGKDPLARELLKYITK